jgi:hypothetical protein
VQSVTKIQRGKQSVTKIQRGEGAAYTLPRNWPPANMKRHTGVGVVPPLLVSVQKEVADIQLRAYVSGGITARVQGETDEDSATSGLYQKMSTTLEGL